MQSSLTLHTFADDRLEVSPTEVLAVEVDGKRVWVRMRSPHIMMVEAKNAEDVLAWGRDSDKLEGEDGIFGL